MSQESDSSLPPRLPMRELLLAHALDTCIAAERRLPGSADLIIARQPEWARAELRRLVSLASALDGTATNAVMSEEFRVAARARLMQEIGGQGSAADGQVLPVSAWLATVPSRNGYHKVAMRRRARWMWRGAAGGLLASVLAVAATLTASANSLPGEPLYSLKQASEELGVRLAPDNQARALALLNQADARLDETARLLQAGHTDQVAQTTQRFDDIVNRATTTFVVTITDAPPQDPATAHVNTILSQQQQQIESMLSTAPEPAQADLRQALVAAERSRALVADAESTDRAEARTGAGKTSVAAAEPTVAVEVEEASTAAPSVAEAPPTPAVVRKAAEESPSTPGPVVASDRTERNEHRATAQRGEGERDEGRHGGRGAPPPAQASAPPPPVVVEQDADSDDSPAKDAQPPVIASAPRNGEHGNRGNDGGGRGSDGGVHAAPSAPSTSTESHADEGDDIPVPGAVAHASGNAAPATHEEQPKFSPPPVVSQPERDGGDARPSEPSSGAHVQATPVPTVTVKGRGGDGGSGRGGNPGSDGGSSIVSGASSNHGGDQGNGGGDHSGGNGHSAVGGNGH